MDLATTIQYRDIFKIRDNTQPYSRRKNGKKIIPNYDSTQGYGNRYMYHSYGYADLTYTEYKTFMLEKIRKCEETTYKGMIVNRGGHPKTNTNETCYRHLRHMIKDGILKMEKRSAYGRQILSVVVIVK